jgi:uncharacterized protein YgbK (DUF1537 family)
VETEKGCMIGVIADDLTGAAELGALGWSRGLHAEVIVTGNPSCQADLVCLDTDSRSCLPAEAARRAASAASVLVESRADWVYKKVDSVLRGNVVGEIAAIMRQLRLKLALVVPANPSLGRVIRGGRYFVRGRPLDETEFARDPEHPRRSSLVLQLLADYEGVPVRVGRLGDSLPPTGIVVGEVEAAADLQQWGARRSTGMLLAGGAEFFGALLAATGCAMTGSMEDPEPASAAGTELFVCGSISDSCRAFVRRAQDCGTPVFSLPEELARGMQFTAELAEAIAQSALVALRSQRRVILHSGLDRVGEPALAKLLAVYLVQVAERVLRETRVGQVYAEGGTTAAELVRRMGWGRLKVLRELSPGVATLTADDNRALQLTIKPGSYLWPEGILNV